MLSKCLHSLVIYLLTICIFYPVLFAQEREKDRLAVLNLINSAKLSDAEVDFLTNLIRQAIAKKGRDFFIVMTQENITLMLPPDKKIEECVSECEVDTGRLLGAKYIITGTVLKFGESLRVNLKFHETQNAALLSSYTVKGVKVEDLEGGIETAAQELFSELVNFKASHTKTLTATALTDADTKAKADADAKAKADADAKANADTKAKADADAKAKADADAKAKADADAKAKADADAKAKADTKAKADADKLTEKNRKKFFIEIGGGTYSCSGEKTSESDCGPVKGAPTGFKMHASYMFNKSIGLGLDYGRYLSNYTIPIEYSNSSIESGAWSRTQDYIAMTLQYKINLQKIELTFNAGIASSTITGNQSLKLYGRDQQILFTNTAKAALVKTGLSLAYYLNQTFSIGSYIDILLSKDHQVDELCTNIDLSRNDLTINPTKTCYSSASLSNSYQNAKLDTILIPMSVQVGLFLGMRF
jgi:hypothetical protein